MKNRRQKLSELIMGKIRSGEIVEGSKLLPERELAQKLNVSRNLLREALVMLECMNCIEVHGREGIFISNTDGEEFNSTLNSVTLWPENMVRDLMEMREIIEVPAAGIAALRHKREDLEKMEQCVDELDRIFREGESRYGDGAKWDSLLHSVIVKATGNPLLVRVSEDLSIVLEKYIGQSRALVFSSGNWPRIILEQHRELYEQIKTGNRKNAERTAHKHIALARKKFAG